MVKNAMSMVGKYVEDPKMRLLLANRAMDAVDSAVGERDVAAAVKLGFVAANVEIMDKLLRDEEFSKDHGEELNVSLNKIFGNNKEINELGNKYVREEMDANDKKRFSYGTGKYPFTSRFSK